MNFLKTDGKIITGKEGLVALEQALELFKNDMYI